MWDTSILTCHTETYDCFESNAYIVNIPQLHIENQGSEGQFGEISCENGFSCQFRRRYTLLGFNEYCSRITNLFFIQMEMIDLLSYLEYR